MTSARGQKGGVELAASHRAKALGLDLPGRAGKRVWALVEAFFVGWRRELYEGAF